MIPLTVILGLVLLFYRDELVKPEKPGMPETLKSQAPGEKS